MIFVCTLLTALASIRVSTIFVLGCKLQYHSTIKIINIVLKNAEMLVASYKKKQKL